MKKLINLWLFVVLLIMSSLAIGGGPEMAPAPAYVPPEPEMVIRHPDFFSGVTVGLVGSANLALFGTNERGILVCPQEPDENCLPVDFTPNPVIRNPDLSGVISAKMNENAFWGGGFQLGLGKVIHTRSFIDYFLGLYGDVLFGEVTHTFEVDTLRSLILAPDLQIAEHLSTNVEAENMYEFGGEIGILFFPRTLTYIKGGAVWSQISHSAELSTVISTLPCATCTSPLVTSVDVITRSRGRSKSNLEAGYALGFGVAQAFTEHWLFSLEFVYRNFSTLSAEPSAPRILFPNNPDSAFVQITDSKVKIATAGMNAILSYRFGVF